MHMTQWPTIPRNASIIGSARSDVYPEREREGSHGDDAMADPVGMPEGLRRAFPYTVFSRWSVDVDQATWDNVVKEALPHWTAAFMASLEELGENDNDDDRSGRW